MYGYDQADQSKRTLLDQFFKANTPKTQDDFFGIVANGGKISPAQYNQFPEAAAAQHIFDTIGKYKNADSGTLYNAMVD